MKPNEIENVSRRIGTVPTTVIDRNVQKHLLRSFSVFLRGARSEPTSDISCTHCTKKSMHIRSGHTHRGHTHNQPRPRAYCYIENTDFMAPGAQALGALRTAWVAVSQCAVGW